MSNEQFVLAVDQGTTNTKALLVNSRGQIVAQAAHPVGITFPQPGWVEQSALEIWQSVRAVVDDCLASAGHPPMLALAISNQRETSLAWDRRTGQPLGPVVSWQCRRTTGICAALQTPDNEKQVYARTGLALDPMFSAAKFRWLLDHIPQGHSRAQNGDICLGTVDSWLVYQFTGGSEHRTDVTNASRTQLFNLQQVDWDDDLLALFGVPRAALPRPGESSSLFGETVALGYLPAGVPICGVVGDSHGALFGHTGFQPGAVKATYGTGSSLMSPVTAPPHSRSGLSGTIAWGESGVTYALEGNIYTTGATVQWLRDFLSTTTQAIADLAASVPDTEGVYLVPAFVGLGAPHWDANARALISGLTRGSSAAHVARAAVESIAYQIRDVFDRMEADSGTALHLLLADGGATRNNMLMQFQADLIGRPVVRNNSTHLSALGAAYLAGLYIRFWDSRESIAALPRAIDRFDPAMSPAQRERLLAGWQEAVARTLYHPPV